MRSEASRSVGNESEVERIDYDIKGEKVNERRIVSILDEQFNRLHLASCHLIESIPAEILYRLPRRTSTGARPIYSCGELILRSAGSVEQTFGGITVNLWDDPFEWTLPEALPHPEDILSYLAEAETMRERGFALFKSDDDLSKNIAVPSCEMRNLAELLIETLRVAAHYQGQAFATVRVFCDVKLPRL